MIIDFDKIETKKIENFRGGESTTFANMHVDENNKIIKLTLLPGASIGMHRHEGDSETFMILEGEGKILFEGEELPIKAGEVHYCPEGCEHSLINTGEDELVVFAVIPTHK